MTEFSNIEPGIEMAVRLRRACEAHDPTIGEHLNRVAQYACDLGRIVGLSKEELVELHHAAPLHDLGKIGLPIELLNKRGSLSADEFDRLKTHCVIGYQILQGSSWRVIHCAARIALSHHECWNGTGYPQGLRGDEIPLDARIVAIADVYDALLSRRAYKPAWDLDSVVAELRRLRGSKFDPDLLDAFLANLPCRAAPAA